MKELMKELRIFTVMTLIAAIVVILLQAASVKAECDDPAGQTFMTGCCGSEVELTFSARGGYSPWDPCECGEVAGLPYRWDANACTAIVYESECGGKALTYIVFNGAGFTASPLPAFVQRIDD